MGRGSEQAFSQKQHTDGQQVYAKMLTSLIIREIQIKTTMRYHFTFVKITTITKTRDNKCWQGCGEQDPLCATGVNANWYSHCGKQYGGSSKNFKKNCHVIQ